MPSDWIDDTKLSALRKRLRNVGSETADQAAEAVGDLWRHIEEQDQLRAAHQERDADARLDCDLARFGVSIREGALPRGRYGEWDETTGIVTIAEDQHPIGKHVVLIHELLHVTESLLLQEGVIKRRVGEAFVTHAAPILLGLLVSAGRYSGTSESGLAEFYDAAMAADTQTEGDDAE